MKRLQDSKQSLDNCIRSELLVKQPGPGEVQGELSLVDPGPRMANLRAVAQARCIEFDWEGLARMRRYYPSMSADLMINLSHILGGRLAQANRTIIASKLKPPIE